MKCDAEKKFELERCSSPSRSLKCPSAGFGSQDQPSVALFLHRVGQVLPQPSSPFDHTAVVPAANAVGKFIDFLDVAAAKNDIVGHHNVLQRGDDLQNRLLPLLQAQLLKA